MLEEYFPLRRRLVKNTKRIIASAVFLILFFTLVSFVSQASAQDLAMQNNLNVVANSAGVGRQADIITIIGRLINVALGFVGVLLLVMMLFSGYQYMTAGGDPEKVKKAITRIRNTIIGLLIIVASFAIVNFIMGWLTGKNSIPSSFVSQWQQPVGFGGWSNSGSYGSGVIESHYPERDQKDVPRNTAIAITFKEAIDPASFALDWTPQSQTPLQLNNALIKIHPQQNINQDLAPDQARVTVTPDKKTVIIKPNDPLGNTQSNTWYEVVLIGGADGIKNASGTALFTGKFESGYSWAFEVSTQIDNKPPHVTSRIPSHAGIYDRNLVIQINFSEPMMPISVSGFYNSSLPSPFINITTKDETHGSKIIPGEYRITNNYRTVEFITDDNCGRNSCGMDMFCLPSLSTVSTLVHAATLSGTPPLAAEVGSFGFDGAVDMAGNSLDGNNDGEAKGPGQDDYHPDFVFTTTDQIRLTGPVISAIDPAPPLPAGNVALDKTIDITWTDDDLLLSYSVNSNNVYLTRKGPDEDKLNDNSWWWHPVLSQLNTNGDPVDYGEDPIRSRISITHRPFLPSNVPAAQQTAWDVNNYYAAHVGYQILDMYQNCFTPASSAVGGQVKYGNNNLCNEQAFAGACEALPSWNKP